MATRGRNLSARFTTLLSLIGGAGLLVLLIRWYGSDLHLSLARLQLGYGVLYFMSVPVVVAAYSARWQMAARAVGSSLPLGRLMAARLAGDAVGALMPSAKVVGDPVRIALLHADGVSLVTASAGVTLDRLCEMTGNVIAATVYTLVFINAQQGGANGAATDLLVSVGFLCVAAAVPVGLLWRGARPLAPMYWVLDGRVSARWARLLAGARAAESRVMAVFRDHPRFFVTGVGMSLLIECLVVIQYAALLHMCGISLSLATLLLALVLGGLSRALPSPAALGTLEASQIAALSIAGQPAAMGLAVGLVMRLHETLLMAGGMAVCLVRGVSPARLRMLAPADGGAA